MLLHVTAGLPLAGTADSQAINFNGRDADADGNRLPVFAAGADAFIELQIVADHRNSGQDVWSVADQSCAFDQGSDLPIFDEICLGRREDKFSVGDVDLPAAEIHRVDTIFHGANDVA